MRGGFPLAKIKLDSKSRKLMIRETTTSYLFLLPFLLFFVVFVVYPMFMCVYTSFFDATIGREDIFVGLKNYRDLLWKETINPDGSVSYGDPIFWKGLWNTMIIVLVSVPVTCFFSLWVASAISRMPVAATSAFRCIFYLPVVTGSVAVTVVWRWMYSKFTGVLNYVGNDLLGLFSENVDWLGDSKYALGCIILILLTTSVGQPIVLYVSALDNVDKSLVEAAEVDGATRMQAFWRIKWPQMMPTTLYILVITTINSFQCFALIQLLTSGGPNNSTMTIMYYIYYNAFQLYKYGYGNAMGVILAIIIAILSAVQFWAGKEK
jgi:multiple sugar transport system permease protein